MEQGEARRMQHLAFYPAVACWRASPSVLAIAEDRVADVGHMDADLMRSSRFDFDI